MARFSEYAKNVGMMVSQSLVQRVLGLLTTMVLARFLGAPSFGAYSVVANTASSAFGLVKLGIDASIHVSAAEFRPDAALRERKGETLAAGFLLLALAGGAGALVCLALSNWLALYVFGDRSLAVWIRVAGAAVFLQAVSQFCYATMAGLQRFTTYGRIMIGSALVSAIAISAGAVSAGLYGAVVAMIGAQLVTAVWLLRSTADAVRAASLRLSLRNFFPRAAELIKAGLPFYAAGLVSIPVTYILQGMVVVSSGLEALGFLRAISALVMIVTFVPVSASGPMISMLVRARSEGEESLPHTVIRNLRMVLVFALLMAATITIVLPWLMPAIFGIEYAGATGAAGIALLSAVLTGGGAVIGNALFSTRRVDLLFLATALQMGVFLSVGALLIPAYGLVGYLVAELLGVSALLIAATWRAFPWLRTTGVPMTWSWKLLFPAALLAVYTSAQIARDGVLSIASAGVGLVGLVIAAVWIYHSILDSSERNVILRLAWRR